MQPNSFEWNGATVRLRDTDEMTIDDVLGAELLPSKLDDKDSLYLRGQFVDFMAAAEIDGDIGFPLPPLNAPIVDIQAAFEQWRKLPAKFLKQWRKLVDERETTSTAGENPKS